MTTSKKLWLGFGMLTALLVLFSVTIIVRLRSIEGNVEAQANVARPRSAATRELEINVLDYALGVHEYLRDGDPKARQRAAKDAADVEGERAEYERFAMTDRQRELATRFAAMWNEMYTLGQTILNAENRQPKREDVTRFHGLRTELEKFLDDEMQVDALDTYNARSDATLQDVQTIVGFALILLIVGVAIAVVTSGAVGRGIVQSERQLWDSRERLRVTLASIGDGIITTDERGRMTGMNAVAESLTGWTQADAVGRRLEEVFVIVNEETRRPAENPVGRVLSEGVIAGLAKHSVLISKNGREIPVDDSAAPIKGENGRIAGVVLVFRDVTARRQAEQHALQERERRFAKIFHASPVATALTTHRDSRFLDVNPRFLELTGYRREELVGHAPQVLRLLGPPSERDRMQAQLRDVGALREVAVGYQHRDGQERRAIASVERIEIGGEDCLLTLLWRA